MEETRTSSSQNPIAPSAAPTMIHDEELENYFSVPLTDPYTEVASPIYFHLILIKEELQKPFPFDTATSARLERSLLKVTKLADSKIPIFLRQTYTKIVLSLSEALLDYKCTKLARIMA